MAISTKDRDLDECFFLTSVCFIHIRKKKDLDFYLLVMYNNNKIRVVDIQRRYNTWIVDKAMCTSRHRNLVCRRGRGSYHHS